MSYRQLHFTLHFLTPAFLGDAEQNGRWRTPPIKAQLRQWWRVVYAADKNFNVDVSEMRREEGLLFGNAWLEDSFCKSRVRLRLSHWKEGSLKKSQWPRDESVVHPEVTTKDGKAVPVGSSLYLGYGPLIYDKERRATSMKTNAAIQANESAILSIAFPVTHDDPALPRVMEENVARIERAIALANLYGTLGGRSRNGWGSFHLTPTDDGTPRLETKPLPLRPWRDCLNAGWDWPHAIGRDDKGPLIWQTAPHPDWKSLMKTLAVVKIGLRTQFPFRAGKDERGPEERHWLSYPVTNHNVSGWREKGKGDLRLPNALRFKVRPTSDGQLVGVIFHVPHLPPNGFRPDRQAIEKVWVQVHRFLDQPAQDVKRIAA